MIRYNINGGQYIMTPYYIFEPAEGNYEKLYYRDRERNSILRISPTEHWFFAGAVCVAAKINGEYYLSNGALAVRRKTLQHFFKCNSIQELREKIKSNEVKSVEFIDTRSYHEILEACREEIYGD